MDRNKTSVERYGLVGVEEVYIEGQARKFHQSDEKDLTNEYLFVMLVEKGESYEENYY